MVNGKLPIAINQALAAAIYLCSLKLGASAKIVFYDFSANPKSKI
jgi:hypothetical protein